jgi:hypothetical protein
MEANITTSLFKETIFAEEIMEINVVIDPALPLLKVVDNCFQLTPPSTIVGPLRKIHKLHAQTRKKKS